MCVLYYILITWSRQFHFKLNNSQHILNILKFKSSQDPNKQGRRGGGRYYKKHYLTFPKNKQLSEWGFVIIGSVIHTPHFGPYQKVKLV